MPPSPIAPRTNKPQSTPAHPQDPRAKRPIQILLVDDEAAIRRALQLSLSEFGFVVTEASRGEEALHRLEAQSYDAVLLDLNMPGIGGMRTLLRIRARLPRVPILILTVRDQEDDKVEALESGADDYLTKPFSMRECVARIRATMRTASHISPPQNQPLTVGELRIDPDRRLFYKRDEPVHLTPKEYGILEYMMRHEGRAITHGRLLNNVWGPGHRFEVETLRTFIRTLRKKIEDNPAEPQYLLTEAYLGYRFTNPFYEETDSSLT